MLLTQTDFIKFKRIFFIKNIRLNLKRISEFNSFVLFINFLSPDFFKLSPVLINLLNSFLSSFSASHSFANVSFQQMFFKTSSKAYMLYFTDITSLLLFVDLLLRLKLNFYIKGIFDLKKSKFISIFNIAQDFNSKLVLASSHKKFKLQLVKSFFNFYYPKLLNLFVLINLIYKK